MRKTFQDLSVGDKLFKVHYDFKHNNFSIETKIIKEIKTPESSSKFLRDNEIVFVFDTGIIGLASYDSYCKLDKTEYQQHYFECHQIMISSNESPDGEYVYYTTDENVANDILKRELQSYIDSLYYQKTSIEKDIEKFEDILKNKI